MNGEQGVERRNVERQLIKWLGDDTVDVNLLTGLAGDRELSEEEQEFINRLQSQNHNSFFTDLLFVLTQKHFPPNQAKSIWREIINHKNTLNEAVDRNVGIFVAALDYLSNIRGLIKLPTLVPSHQLASVAELALRDGLTGLYVHSTVLTKLETEIKKWERYGDRSCVMMLDIDDFKNVNDTFGHQKGDQVLTEIANTISGTIREIDIVGRYGGEEFMIIVPRTSVLEANRIADRIRINVERCRFHSISVTISIGVSAYPQDGKTARSLIRAADEALGYSKRTGKNCTTFYQQIEQIGYFPKEAI